MLKKERYGKTAAKQGQGNRKYEKPTVQF